MSIRTSLLKHQAKALKIAATTICSIVLIIFAVFVWPTRFWYEHTRQQVIRINRFTDEMSYLDSDDGVWTKIKSSSTDADKALDEILQRKENQNVQSDQHIADR